MPALADRLFSWTVPIEGVEGGGRGRDWDGGEDSGEAGWWWEDGRGSEAPISPCCASQMHLFSLALYSPALTSLSFISRAVKAASGGSLDAACQGASMIRNTHSAHRVSCEAHLHPILRRDGPSLYNYKEARTENLYLSALMIKLHFLSFSPSQLCTIPPSLPLFSSSAAAALTRPPSSRSIPNARVLRGRACEPLDKIWMSFWDHQSVHCSILTIYILSGALMDLTAWHAARPGPGRISHVERVAF